MIHTKRLEDYINITRPDDHGTFVAYIPAIPGCHAIGKSVTEARQQLELVFEMILEEYQEENKPLPNDVEIYALPITLETVS